MELRADARVPFPRPVVFAVYRDELASLVHYLPNVRGVEVASRDVDRGRGIVKIVNVWHGGGEIPKVARSVLREAMLSWTDRATWDEAAFTCDWTIETHAFTDAVSCKGRHRFVDEGDATRLETRGELVVDAGKVGAVPRLLAGRVSRLVEEFLAAKIEPNLAEVSRGLARYLAERAAG
jgi:hypothetical protein